jgi:hypothetical protein
VSKKNKHGFQPQQQVDAQQTQQQNVFAKMIGTAGENIGWFAGKVVAGFNAATAKVETTVKAAVTEVKKVATAAYTKAGNGFQTAYTVVGSALTSAALAIAAIVTGAAKSVWNVRAMDVLAVVWIVASTAAAVFAFAAAFGAALVLTACTAAPATALVSELAPAASLVLTYAGVGVVAWFTAAIVEVGQTQIVRICQRVHACIEQAARDLAANVSTAGAKMRHALTVDAVAVAGA